MKRSTWRKQLGPGYFGRLVDFNTNEVRPGRLLVQEGDFGYAVMGLGAGAATILRWLDRPGQGLALDQATFSHADVPDWVRKLDVPELRRLATLEALAGPEQASEAFWRYNHNHWPAGSPGGVGGEFAPCGSGDEPGRSDSTPRELTDLANLPQTAWSEVVDRVSADASATAHTPSDRIDPPKYKRSFFDGPKRSQEWDDALQAARALPGGSQNLTYAIMMTFAAEGGMQRAGNGRIAGLDADTIEAAVQAGLVKGPFSADQVPAVYHFVMDPVFHHMGGVGQALDKIGHSIGERQAAAALFDTLFWFGTSGGTKLVQFAINNVVGPEPGPETVPMDGEMGPQTLDEYITLAQYPATRHLLLDKLAAMRLAKAEALSHNHHHRQREKNRIDYDRINFFQFLDHK